MGKIDDLLKKKIQEQANMTDYDRWRQQLQNVKPANASAENRSLSDNFTFADNWAGPGAGNKDEWILQENTRRQLADAGYAMPKTMPRGNNGLFGTLGTQTRRNIAGAGLMDYSYNDIYNTQLYNNRMQRDQQRTDDAVAHLYEEGWEGYSKDKDYSQWVNNQMRIVEQEMKRVGPNDLTYSGLANYYNYLQQISEAYMGREYSAGFAQDEAGYNQAQKLPGVVEHLDDTSWEGMQQDLGYKATLAVNIQMAEAELAKAEPGSARYNDLKEYVDYLHALQGAYFDRAEVAGSMDEASYDAWQQASSYFVNNKDKSPAYVYNHLQGDLNQDLQTAQRKLEKAKAARLAAQSDLDDAKAMLNGTAADSNKYAGYSPEQLQEIIRQKEQELDAAGKAEFDASNEVQHAQSVMRYGRSMYLSQMRGTPEFNKGVEAGKTAFEPVRLEIETHRANRAQEVRTGNVEVAGLSEEELAGEDWYTYRAPGENWSQEDQDTWYYLYSKDPEQAYQYAIDLNRSNMLQARQEKMGSYSDTAYEHPVVGALAGTGMQVLTSPMGLWDYFGDLVQYGNTGLVMPRDELSARDVSNAITGGAATRMNDWYTTPEGWAVIGGKGIGDLYQLGNSMAESMAWGGLTKGMLALGAPEKFASAVINLAFFGNAASETTQDAIARGVPAGKALLLGAAAGAAEAAGETFSIENLVHMKAPTSRMKLVKEIMKQGGVEASEEGFTTFINSLADAWIMGDKSELNQNIQGYMAKGMSRRDAEKAAWKEWANGIAFDMLGGFLSGGGSGAVYGGVNMYTANRSEYINYDRQDLIQIGLEQPKGSEAYNIAEKAWQSGRLTQMDALKLEQILGADVESMRDQKRFRVTEDASSRLEKAGLSADLAHKYAEAVTQELYGDELGRQERKAYNEAFKNESVQTVANEMQTERQQGLQQQYRDVATYQYINSILNADKQNTGGKVDLRADQIQNLKLESGETISVQSAEMKDGQMVLTYKKGGETKTTPLSQMKLSTEQKEVFRQMERILGDDAAYAYNSIGDSGVSTRSVVKYATQFAQIRDLFGAKGVSLERALASNIRNGMTDAQVEWAYGIGKKRGVQTDNRKASQMGTGKVSLDGGTVRSTDGEIKLTGVKDQASIKKDPHYKAIQRLAYMLKLDVVMFEGAVDQKGVSRDNIMGSYADGKIYINVNAGMEKGTQRMLLRTFSHELTHFIQQNAKSQYQDLKNAVTDYLADKMGQDFNDLVKQKLDREPGISYQTAMDEVIADACEGMLADSKAVQQLMDKRPNLFRTIRDKFLAFLKRLYDEAGGVQDEGAKALRDEIERFQELWDKGLLAAVENREGAAVSEKRAAQMSVRNEALSRLSEGGQEIVESLGKDAEIQVNKNGDMLLAESKDGHEVAFSVKTYDEGGKEKLIQALKENGHTQEEIDAVIENIEATVDFLVKLAQQYSDSYGYENLKRNLWAGITTNLKTGKQVLSALVNNGDYPVNIDLQLICKKRTAYMRMLTRLIDDGVFEKVNFKGAAIADLNAILRDNGFETACLGCFVESRRLQLQAWAETIVEEWNDEVDKRKQNAGGFNFAQGGNKLSAEDILNLSMELESAGKKNDKGNLNLGKGGVKEKMGRLLDKVPSLAQHLTVADLLTPDGLKTLRAYDQNLFSLVKQRYGAASPKIVQDFNPYNSEMADLSFQFVKKMIGESVTGSKKYMDQAKRETPRKKGESTAEYNRRVETLAVRKYLYDIGGARIQSFSDFMIENVFDYMQIVADLAAREFPLHGYSKEAIFLRLFGMTGGKFNGSLIAHVEGKMGKEYAGLLPAEEASNGRGIILEVDGKKYAICFDDYARNVATGSFIQSIGLKDIVALQLDPRYSKNVGSITIGVSDKQILAMLDSPYFRMVIPYHASGMIPEFAKLVGVDNYNDYTDYQTTKVAKCFDLNGNPVEGFWKADGKKLEIDTHYNFNEAVQRLGDAKKAAQEYLDWCPQRHPVYDGKKLVGYATFKAKFSDSPYGTDFTTHPNYYKLLEDFNVYDSIGEASALQGPVTMTLPSEANRLTAEQMTAYKQALRETGLFTEKEIEKYAKKADMTFQELIQEEIGNRAEYESQQAKVWDETVDKAEKMLLEKYGREIEPIAQMSTKNAASEGDTAQMSIKTIPGTTQKYVQADRQVLYGDDPDAWGVQLTRFINKNIRNGKDVPLNTSDGRIINLTATTAEKGAFRNNVREDGTWRQMTDEEYATKLNAEAHIDELVQVSEEQNPGKPNKPDYKNLHGPVASGGWRYRDAFFMDFDGKYYKCAISVAHGVDGEVAYNVGKVEERPFPGVSRSSTPESGAYSREGSSGSIVTDTSGDVNAQSSVRSTNKTDRELLRDFYDRVVAEQERKATREYELLQKAHERTYKMKQGVIDRMKKEQRQALEKHQQALQQYEEQQQVVRDTLVELDAQVAAGADPKAVTALRAKLAAQEKSLFSKLQKLVQSEKSEDLRELIRAERELEREIASAEYEQQLEAKDAELREVREKNQAKLKEVRDARDQKLDELKEQNRERISDIREANKAKALRGRIAKLWKDLNDLTINATKDKHAPVELMKQAVEVLDALNMDTTRIGPDGQPVQTKTSERLKEKLRDIRDAYEKLAKDEDYLMAAHYDSVVEDMLKDMIEKVGDTPINQMSSEQLQSVYNTLMALKKTLSEARKLQLGEEKMEIAEAGKEAIRTARASRNKADSAKSRYVDMMLSPMRFFRKLGNHQKNSVWEKVYRVLDQGQLKQTRIQVEGQMLFYDLMEPTNMKAFMKSVVKGEDLTAAARKWLNKDYLDFVNPKNTVDVGLKDMNGNPVKITHGMLAALYMHLTNEQNAKHIAYGGLTIPELGVYYKPNGDKGKAKASRVGGVLNDIQRLNEEINNTDDVDQVVDLQEQADQIGAEYLYKLRESVESQLTDYDRKWIAAARELFDGMSKRELNQTSMEVFGIKIFNVENYFPISTDKDFLNTPFDTIVSDFTIENSGQTKARVESKKPIMLYDISDVVASQIKWVGLYCGIMPALRTFNKLYGYTMPNYEDSVKKSVTEMFGEKDGQAYIKNLMSDLTGARHGSSNAIGDFFGLMRGHLAQSALTLSPRVSFAQAASFPSAAPVLGWKALHKALWRGGKNHWLLSKNDRELIRKWSPLLEYRMMGYASPVLGDIKNMNDLYSRVWRRLRWLTGWIQAIDGFTVGRLWYAAEYWVQDNMKDLQKGTDAYYEAVAEKFNEAVELTQPNYTLLQRPDILRDPDSFVKSLTMFMTQRLQNFNIMYDAAATHSQMKKDYKDGLNGVTREDVKEAAAESRTAFVSQLLVASPMLVLMKFASDVLLHAMNAYRDDDDELTLKSIGLALLDSYISTIAGNVIGGGELWNIVHSLIPAFNKSYYGIEVSGVAALTDVIDAGRVLMAKYIKGDEVSAKDWKKLASQVSTAAGIPLPNAEKMVNAVKYWLEDASKGQLGSFEAGVDRTIGQQANRLLRAYRDMDGAKVKKVVSEVPYEKQKNLYEAVRKRIKDDYENGEINVYETMRQMKKYGNANDQVMTNFIKEVYADGKISRKEAENLLVKYAGKSQESAEESMNNADAKAEYDVSYDNAHKAYNDGVLTKKEAQEMLEKYGGYSTAEAKAKVDYWEYQKNGGTLSDNRFNTYRQDVAPTGVSIDYYDKLLPKIDANNPDGKTNGRYSQDEAGPILREEVEAGRLTPEQAAAIWNAITTGKATFDDWLAKNK